MNYEHKRQLIGAAETLVQENKLTHYFKAREAFQTLLKEPGNVEIRKQFEENYSKFYHLNSRIVGQEFIDPYFQELFLLDLNTLADPYQKLLLTLKLSSRRRVCMQFSFVSKLVATHDDSKAIYDSNVRRFLAKLPGLSLSIPPSTDRPHNDEVRIRRYIEVLKEIQKEYESWEPEFDEICTPLLERIPKLKDCHRNKVWDFLVWTAGRKSVMGK